MERRLGRLVVDWPVEQHDLGCDPRASVPCREKAWQEREGAQGARHRPRRAMMRYCRLSQQARFVRGPLPWRS